MMKPCCSVIATLWTLSVYGLDSQPIVGTWRLLSMERQSDSGQWEARCHSPTGLITYTSQGYMAVGINCMKGAGSKEPTDDLKDMIFYTGRYELTPTEVVHHIMNSAGADFFGKDLKREFRFEGESRLRLSGKGKNGKIVRLLWERVN